MTQRQKEIYKGLRTIGPEIAALYYDAVLISKSNYVTKSYLLGHLSREIEGGLRDILDPYKKCNNHRESIISSLGIENETKLVNKWHELAGQFNKYVHRSGAWKAPRDAYAFDNLWDEFEDILNYLVGNYFSIADRLDHITKIEKPTKKLIKSLANLLEKQNRSFYFFNHLNSEKWLLGLEKEGYFHGSNNPEPVESESDKGFYSTYWGVLSYLEKISQQNLKHPKKEVTKSLITIIDGISQYKNSEGQRIENYLTDYSIIKLICTLPKKNIADKHFEYIQSIIESKWRSGLVRQGFHEILERLILIGDKELLDKGVKLLLTHRERTEGDRVKVESIFDNYDLESILSKFKNRMIAILGEKILSLGLQKINEVIKLDSLAFSIFSIPAIENHKQTLSPENYGCQLVYLVRDTLERLSLKDINDSLEDMLTANSLVSGRIAIHTIRVRYDELKDYFWNLDQNPLNILFAKHEVYQLIYDHSKNFTKEEIRQVIEWIDAKKSINSEGPKGDEDNNEKFIAYEKKEWLSALEPSGSKIVTDLIKKLNLINDTKVEKPGFSYWSSSSIKAISPLSVDEISERSVEGLINYFNAFKKQKQDFLGPSVNGFIHEISLAVRNNLKKYNDECNALVKAPTPILNAWMNGLFQGIRDKKELDHSKVLETANRILQRENFWKEHINTNDEHSRSFICILLSFIESGLNNDVNVFEVELLPVIKELLFNIIENDTYPIFEYDDLSMTVLNNSKGRIYMALLKYSSLLAIIEGNSSNRWDYDVKELFRNSVDSGGNNPLLFYVIGQFLPHIHYLDEKWTMNNFNKLFPSDSKINWSASMLGYFSHNGKLDKTYFKLFVEGKHFVMGISEYETVFGKSRNCWMIEQICRAYLIELIQIDSDIIKAIIESKNKSIYSNLIYYFSRDGFVFEERQIHKIKLLWIEIHNSAIQLKNFEIDNYILSGCCKWLNSIDKIDEKLFQILCSSIDYVIQRDRYEIIDSLSKHLDNSANWVGLILIKLFEKEASYDISRNLIIEITSSLYKKGLKEIGDKICILHAEQGIHFLRTLYDEHRT